MQRFLKRLAKLRGRSITFVTVPDAGGTTKQWKVPVPLAAAGLLIALVIAAFVTYLALTYSYRVFEAASVKQKMWEMQKENERLVAVIDQQESQLSKLASEAEVLGTKVQELEQLSTQLEQVLKGKVAELEGKQSSLPTVRVKPPVELAFRGRGESGGVIEQTTAQLGVLKAVLPESAERLSQLRASVEAYSDRRSRLPSIWPVRGRVTSTFGSRVHPIERVVKPHDGLDISAPTGTPILATANGVVSFAGWKGGYGWTVIIDHGYGVRTLYAHNKRNVVQKGQRVSRGEIIAYVGSTGISTGPHVHYEVQLNGRPVNPERYLP